jgi:hypothetical protein
LSSTISTVNTVITARMVRTQTQEQFQGWSRQSTQSILLGQSAISSTISTVQSTQSILLGQSVLSSTISRVNTFNTVKMVRTQTTGQLKGWSRQSTQAILLGQSALSSTISTVNTVSTAKTPSQLNTAAHLGTSTDTGSTIPEHARSESEPTINTNLTTALNKAMKVDEMGGIPARIQN